MNLTHFLKLNVFCIEPNGHSAIHIIMDNRGGVPSHHRAEFYITTLPARLNILGHELLKWNPNTDKEFYWKAD